MYQEGSLCTRSCKDGFKVQTGVAGIRLSDGVNGDVEILVNRTWALICGDDWNLDNARVVCSHLGYGDAHYIYRNNLNSPRMILNSRHCFGNEKNIFQCREGMLRFNCTMAK